MSKRILFRAQARKKEGRLELNKKHVPIDWVYGRVVLQSSNKKFADIYPQTSENEKISVYADTICQYTGKNDRYGDKIFENDIITFLAHINGRKIPCKGIVFYNEELTSYMGTLAVNNPYNLDGYDDVKLTRKSISLSECEYIAIVGTVFDGGFDAKCELSEKVKHTAFDDFISIANDVNRLLYDIDPYEYRDNDGVESVDDIAVKLLYTAYRNTVIHKLQEYYDYYMENKEENPDFEHLAERCENITNRLSEYNKQN